MYAGRSEGCIADRSEGYIADRSEGILLIGVKDILLILSVALKYFSCKYSASSAKRKIMKVIPPNPRRNLRENRAASASVQFGRDAGCEIAKCLNTSWESRNAKSFEATESSSEGYMLIGVRGVLLVCC